MKHMNFILLFCYINQQSYSKNFPSISTTIRLPLLASSLTLTSILQSTALKIPFPAFKKIWIK